MMKLLTGGLAAAAAIAPFAAADDASAGDWSATARLGSTLNTSAQMDEYSSLALPDGDAVGIGVQRSIGDYFFAEVAATRLSTEFEGLSGSAIAYDATLGVGVPVGDIALYAGGGYTYASTEVSYVYGGEDGSGDGHVLFAGAETELTSNAKIGLEYRRYEFDADIGCDEPIELKTDVIAVKLRFGF